MVPRRTLGRARSAAPAAPIALLAQALKDPPARPACPLKPPTGPTKPLRANSATSGASVKWPKPGSAWRPFAGRASGGRSTATSPTAVAELAKSAGCARRPASGRSASTAAPRSKCLARHDLCSSPRLRLGRSANAKPSSAAVKRRLRRLGIASGPGGRQPPLPRQRLPPSPARCISLFKGNDDPSHPSPARAPTIGRDHPAAALSELRTETRPATTAFGALCIQRYATP